MELNHIELAWAAGFFDGEGWTANSYDKRRKHPVEIRLGANQIDRRVLDRFKAAIFGLGSVSGPQKRLGNRHMIYVYSAQRWQDVQTILAALWKFLSPVKKIQAIRVLHEFHEANSTRRIYKARKGK